MTGRKIAEKTQKLMCPRCDGLNDWVAVTYVKGRGYSYCAVCDKPSLRSDYKYVDAIEYQFWCTSCDRPVDDAPRNWGYDLILEQSVVHCPVCMTCLGVSEKALSFQ